MAVSSNPNQVHNYYSHICAIDISEVARELLKTRITAENESLLLCDCPNHASQSKKSLHVNTLKQAWFCFGCSVGGNVLHLVEFVQSGAVTSGTSGKMTESHRKARDWLSAKAGFPSLAKHGLNSGQIDSIEEGYRKNQRALECLTKLTEYYYLRGKKHPNGIMNDFCDHYAFSQGLIDDQQIGFAENESDSDRGLPGVLLFLSEAGFSEDEIISTGAFNADTQNRLHPGFERRWTIPYWSRGQVHYMIARRSPQTPDTQYERAKYKKLRTYNEHGHRYIAKAIDNSLLHNEDILLSRPEFVVITEGITDNLSGMQNDLPCVSPVTVSIRRADWPRLLPKFSSVKTIYICGDNEISQAGLKGALKTADVLHQHGIDGRIVRLPLNDAQREARQTLKERFGVDDHMEGAVVVKTRRSLSDNQRSDFDILAEQAKCDLNAFFGRNGVGKKDFLKCMDEAVTPLEVAVSRLSPELPERELHEKLEEVLECAAAFPLIAQKSFAKRIQSQLGKGTVSLTELMDQIHIYKKKDRAIRKTNKKTPQITAPEGTLAHLLQTMRIEFLHAGMLPDYKRMGVAAVNWFAEKGARFFRVRNGEPFMFYADHIYYPTSNARNKRAEIGALLYHHGDILQTQGWGRSVTEAIGHEISLRGKPRDQLSWLHTDYNNLTVFFNLNNERSEIIKIAPEGITLLPNASNEEAIFLRPSQHIAPIKYENTVNDEAEVKLIHDYVLRNLSCRPNQRIPLFAWFATIFLFDLCGTHPLARFDGTTESGKTFAQELLTQLFYGKEHVKRSTVPALYSAGQRDPLIALDNVEQENITPEFITFLLTCSTGIVNEKRAMGTDDETVEQTPKCLVCSSGLETLGGHLNELLSRTLIFDFDKQYKRERFNEMDCLNDLLKQRNTILSIIFRSAQATLSAIKESDALTHTKFLIGKALGNQKRRLHSYLALMHLMLWTDAATPHENDTWKTLSPEFLAAFETIAHESQAQAADDSPIGNTLSLLFDRYQQIVTGFGSDLANFERQYQVKFDSSTQTKWHPARTLHAALSTIAYNHHIPFPIRSPSSLGKRIVSDAQGIKDSGFSIEIMESRGRTKLYQVRQEKI